MSTESISSGPAFAPMVFPSLRNPDQQRLEAAGRTRGYSAGYAAGLRAAEGEATRRQELRDAEQTAALRAGEARVAAAAAALDAATAALDARTLPALATAEQTLAAAAVELAEALLGRELSRGEDSACAALDRALSGTGSEPVRTVRMNPEDLAALERAGIGNAGAGATGARLNGVALVGDPSLARGDAVSEFPNGYLDARLGTALARAKDALLGGAR